MKHNRRYLLFVVFSLLFIFGIAMFTGNLFFYKRSMVYGDTNDTNSLGEAPINPEDENYYKFFPMFQKAYYILKKEYVTRSKVTVKNLIYGAIKGMMQSLGDPYSVFMNPKTTKDFFIDMSAKFGGVGIYIDLRDGWLTVVSPIEDTPAWHAGLKPNDKIIKIEGKSTKGITLEEAVSKLRGTPGTDVRITIKRKSVEEPFNVVLTRENIKIKTVKSDFIKKDGHRYAYVKITQFSMPTADELRAALIKVLKQKPKGLIIDLRNNPGGSLSVVVNCVDMFLNKGLIVYTRGRMSDSNNDYFADKRNTIVPLKLPLVVLINQGSASASEIFSGAMQDTHRGVLVGMKSFGKGSVQKTYTFSEDGSLIKYTIAKYFTPAGRLIDKIGLTPDLEEKNWYEKISKSEQKAIIQVQQTNFIAQFLKKDKNPSVSQVKAFQSSLNAKGYDISLGSLKWLVHLKRHQNEMPAMYDLKFDDQLSAAIGVLEKYDDFKKPIKYYEYDDKK